MKTCKIEGCKSFVWSKGLCKIHSPKTPIKSKSKPIKKYSQKGLEKKKEKTENTKKLHAWFLEVFDKRKNKNGFVYCFETGFPMHEDIYKMNSCIYSHCYPKSNFPQYAFEEWNLLLVLPQVHAQWEANREKTPKMLEYFNNINLNK